MYFSTKLSGTPDYANPHYIPYCFLPRELPNLSAKSSAHYQRSNNSYFNYAEKEAGSSNSQTHVLILADFNESTAPKSNRETKTNPYSQTQKNSFASVSSQSEKKEQSLPIKNSSFFIKLFSASIVPCVGIILGIAGATLLALGAAPLLGVCLITGGALVLSVHVVHKFGIFAAPLKQDAPHSTFIPQSFPSRG